jgi:hypothetical protein
LRKILLLLVLVCSLAPAGSERSGLLSPLAFDSYRTSSFGEYRYNHFHGGVDYSTNGEEGCPVLAIGDGKIVRVKREPEGYGRALYLELKDGRTVVYGHLIRFSRKLGIEQKLDEECRKRGTSFPGDIFLDPPVEAKAGDIVAYSGELGIGFPHLHLEIRRDDSMLDPFNEGVPLPQFSVPKIKSAVFVPRDEGATVNGSLFPHESSLSGNMGSSCSLSREVVLNGAADIYLGIEDNMGSPTYPTLPCEISANIDGKEFFYLNLKEISLAHYKESVFLFEPLNGSGTLILLRARPELHLGEIRGAGLPLLEKGKHRLEITVRNRGGKSCVLKGDIIQNSEPPGLSGAIPCGSVRIIECKPLPTGIGIKAELEDSKGALGISISGRQANFYISRQNSKLAEILIPSSEFSDKKETITVGDTAVQGSFVKGPAQLADGAFRMSIPSSAMAKYTTGASSVSVEISPAGLRPLAQLSCNKEVSKGEALFASGGNFFNYVGAKERSFGKSLSYQIVRDLMPPVWGKPVLSKIKNLGEPELKISVLDTLSGVNPKSVSIFIDSKRVFPDWDSDASTVRLGLFELPKGSHTVSGSAEDKMGNRAELPLTQFFN